VTEQMKDLRDDIAFMRALAEEGRSAPMLGGGILLAAGLIFGAASLLHWTILAGLLKLTPWAFPVIWIGAALGFGLVASLAGRRSRRKIGSNASVNRATGAAWSAVGGAIFVIFLAVAVMAARTGDPRLMDVIPLIILTLYGSAWMVAAAMTRRGWMSAVAIGCYVSAVGMGALGGHPATMLVYAASLLLFASVPGYILLRQEPSDLV
jgi:hypothetical protein